MLKSKKLHDKILVLLKKGIDKNEVFSTLSSETDNLKNLAKAISRFPSATNLELKSMHLWYYHLTFTIVTSSFCLLIMTMNFTKFIFSATTLIIISAGFIVRNIEDIRKLISTFIFSAILCFICYSTLQLNTNLSHHEIDWFIKIYFFLFGFYVLNLIYSLVLFYTIYRFKLIRVTWDEKSNLPFFDD